MPALRWIVSVGSFAACLCGCASYQLGSTNGFQSGSKSIEVAPFLNETSEPRIGAAIVSALRRSLGQDGTYRLDTRGSGDIYVTGVVIRYEREGVSFQPNDVLTARDFRLRLVAKVRASDRNTGKPLLDREVAGHTSLRMQADLPSAERQALPLLAEDLARNITSLLVDGGW